MSEDKVPPHLVEKASLDATQTVYDAGISRGIKKQSVRDDSLISDAFKYMSPIPTNQLTVNTSLSELRLNEHVQSGLDNAGILYLIALENNSAWMIKQRTTLSWVEISYLAIVMQRLGLSLRMEPMEPDITVTFPMTLS